MTLVERVRDLFGASGPRIKVRVFLKGRIGLGWREADRTFSLPEGTTLQELIDRADRAGLDLSGAIAASPHLADTLMLNGERCPVVANAGRVLVDGDEVYLLAPIAGG